MSAAIDILRLRSAGGTDSGFSNVSFLAGFDSSGSFNDESIYSHAGTLEDVGMGQGALGAKFGAFGLYKSSTFSGTVFGNVSYPDHAALELGSGPFTIECWAWFNNAGELATDSLPLVTKWEQVNQRGFVFDVNASALRIITSSTGADVKLNLSAALAWSTSTWYHLACDFDGTKVRLFRNGVMVGSSLTTPTIFNSTAKLRLGAFTNGGTYVTAFTGGIDEVRITKGTSRYPSDSNFSVPTAAFPRN